MFIFFFLTQNMTMKRSIFFLLTFLFLSISFFPLTNTTTKADSFVDLPIIMYHSILKSKTGNYIVSPSNLRNDIVWLKKNGYTSIFVQDVIDFCEGKKPLPQKPILITFDDGHYNNYFYAYPIIKEEGFKANINIIGCHSEFCSKNPDHDNPNYSHLTWEEIKEMKESGVWEVGNHTYNMHKFKPRFGITKLPDESSDEYEKAIKKDVMKLEDKFKNNCGFRSNIFAFPFGKYSTESIEILSDCGFKAFLTCNEKINKLEFGNSKNLRHLGRFNRTGTLSTEDFFKKILV